MHLNHRLSPDYQSLLGSQNSCSKNSQNNVLLRNNPNVFFQFLSNSLTRHCTDASLITLTKCNLLDSMSVKLMDEFQENDLLINLFEFKFSQ